MYCGIRHCLFDFSLDGNPENWSSSVCIACSWSARCSFTFQHYAGQRGIARALRLVHSHGLLKSKKTVSIDQSHSIRNAPFCNANTPSPSPVRWNFYQCSCWGFLRETCTNFEWDQNGNSEKYIKKLKKKYNFYRKNEHTHKSASSPFYESAYLIFDALYMLYSGGSTPALFGKISDSVRICHAF